MNPSLNSQPWGLTVRREAVGAVFLIHGCQKPSSDFMPADMHSASPETCGPRPETR